MKFVYPAVMTVENVRTLNNFDKKAERVHVDIMDGIFVPHKTEHLKEMFELLNVGKYYCWFHLMMAEPMAFLKGDHALPLGMMSFHIESDVDAFLLAKFIREKKYEVGIILNPKTRVEEMISLLPIINQVLVMSVEPGYSGQHFLAEVKEKIMFLVSYRRNNNLTFRIGVDGGVDLSTITDLIHLGVDDFAVGDGIFGQNDPEEAYWLLHNMVKNEQQNIMR
jgi:ribulose-phosphate 3-epimerase